MIKYYKETMQSYCLKCRKNTESINPKQKQAMVKQ